MNDALMSVREIIDAAIGREKACTVNFRMLKTVLLILANQLRISDRQVQIAASSRQFASESDLSVSEITIEVDGKKSRRKTSSRSASILKTAKDDPQACIPEADIVCRSAPHLPVDIMEEQKERELRIIDQRANSLEEPARSPTPMASVDSLSKEKLLLVGPPGHAPRLSLVTKEEFSKLSRTVRKLQAKYEPTGIQGFPENAEFMKALRHGASLTDAMAAFHLSSRLEVFEKAFEIVFSLLTELAKKTPGVDMSEIEAIAKEVSFIKGQPDKIQMPEKQVESVIKLKDTTSRAKFEDEEVKDCVTLHELEVALGELRDDVVENVRKITNSTRSDAANTKRTISDLAQKLSASLDVMERFETLETTVAQCADKVEALDIGLSSQITNYQEELAQMQHELGSGLDSLEQTLANMSHDPDAIADLNKNFKALQEDIENLATRQKALRDFQHKMAVDLAGLWQQIELIRDTKADREEVSDALRDKAGIGDLNAMVTVQYFDAVRGDLESKIRASYEKFNNQEAVWQHIIDEVISRLNDKGDWVHFCDLRDDMSRHLNDMRDKVNALAELIGESRAAAISKELFRDTACISCRKPARMQLESKKLPILPALKRQSADGAEAADHPKEDGDGDHGVCYVGKPIPHPRDQRSHMCNRYCGGSHTVLPSISRAPRAMTISALPRQVSETVGADGKVYQTDELKVIKPCVACNIPKAIPHSSEAPEPPAQMLAKSMSDIMSGMDWLPANCRTGSYTPPFPSITDE